MALPVLVAPSTRFDAHGAGVDRYPGPAGRVKASANTPEGA